MRPHFSQLRLAARTGCIEAFHEVIGIDETAIDDVRSADNGVTRLALAGIIGGKIWHEGATLPQFKLEIAAWMAFLMLLILAPLFFFVTQLADAKVTGLREYDLFASRYVAEFRRKWIEGHAAKDEPLIGTADIQSLADLSNSFQVVQDMGLVPFGRATVIRLALFTALPLAPLTLTMIPIEQLIDRALAVFF